MTLDCCQTLPPAASLSNSSNTLLLQISNARPLSYRNGQKLATIPTKFEFHGSKEAHNDWRTDTGARARVGLNRMEGTIYRYYVPKNAHHHPRQHVNPRSHSSPYSSPSHHPPSPSASSSANNYSSPTYRRPSTTISDFSGSDQRRDSASTPTKDMDAATIKGRRGTSGSISSSGSNSSSHNLLANPFELRYGRRYLRENPYPLPCDLSELQRQSLRTLLGVTIFAKPSCAPQIAKNVPKRVLEVGCGSAYWSSSCHEWFAGLGHPDVEFTGLDVAPLAPDLKKHGVNWRFVQHDFRRYPWPFETGEFDYIMLKDLSLTVQTGAETQGFVDEALRILAAKGTLELWESDHVLRCLLPQPPPPRGTSAAEEETAQATKTYLISSTTPFAPAQNKYIADSNTWIHAALDKLNLPSSPCARISQILFQEPESIQDVCSRRVAVPLGQLRWEKDSEGKYVRSNSSGNIFGTPPKGKAKAAESVMTDDQAALRSTALLIVVQKIESLEPLLKQASGKNAEEWTRWWSSMMASLLDQENGSSGEVLEMGAWWATRC